MPRINASKARVVEESVDPNTGEIVTTARDAHNIDAPKTEISRREAPEILKSDTELLREALIAKGVITKSDIDNTRPVATKQDG